MKPAPAAGCPLAPAAARPRAPAAAYPIATAMACLLATVAACLPAPCLLAMGISTSDPAPPVAARAATDDLDALMRLLAARRHGEASFVEQHFMSLLKRPLESSGELLYDAPGHLEKRTLEPRAESLVLDADVVTVQRGRHSHVLELKAYPQVLPFVESIRATLAGDRGALERVFHLEFSGTAERWTLVLAPLDAEVAKTVAQVRIDGMRDVLIKVEIRQSDGDRSLMTLRPHAGS